MIDIANIKTLIRLSLAVITQIGLMCILMSPSTVNAETNDSSGAVIFAYHRIDEHNFPLTNILFDEFNAHIAEIQDGGYHPAGLPEIIDAFRNNTPLPDKTISLTFEGGHKSIMDKAVPLLLEKNIPFTIFVASDMIERDPDSYISWAQLRTLARHNFVTIGIHPATYQSIANLSEQEARAQINRAKSVFQKEMGFAPLYFSYPFGELNEKVKLMIEQSDFQAAFGLQSGVAHAGADIFMLPRFAMTEGYSDINRFQLTALSLPLPAYDITPLDPLLLNPKPAIGFTLPAELAEKDSISCFAPSEGRLAMQILNNRIEIRLNEPFSEGRARINCTMPAGYDERGYMRWRWFGMLFSIVPENNGISTE